MPGYNIQIEKLCKNIKIGGLISTPSRIEGGLLYRMHDVNTTAGRYAIKVLNPMIMERSGACENYRIKSLEKNYKHYYFIIRGGMLGKFMKKLMTLDRLICDEWGFVPVDRDGAQLLFQVIS